MNQQSDVSAFPLEVTGGDAVCCDLCGSHEREFLTSVADGSYFTCGGCGLVYSIADENSLSAFYDHSYYAPGARTRYATRVTAGADDSPQWSRRWHRKTAERLASFESHRQSGAFLEIGCSLGDFLNVVQRAGWDAVGVEISEAAASYARNKWGLDVRTGTLEAVVPELKPESFDVIWAANLLEHVVSPGEFLADVDKLLRPGGVLIASTLNFDSWAFQFSGGEWEYLHSAKEHRYVFSPKLLERYCANSNLELEEIDTTGFRWISKTQKKRWYSSLVRVFEQGVSNLARLANQGHRVQFMARKPHVVAVSQSNDEPAPISRAA
jgi:2-polyprenyl-3-methyl-5-hydroxy-6-metoxy-1,4-benzoquinol methylase